MLKQFLHLIEVPLKKASNYEEIVNAASREPLWRKQVSLLCSQGDFESQIASLDRTSFLKIPF